MRDYMKRRRAAFRAAGLTRKGLPRVRPL
jgi:hypothetical protein